MWGCLKMAWARTGFVSAEGSKQCSLIFHHWRRRVFRTAGNNIFICCFAVHLVRSMRNVQPAWKMNSTPAQVQCWVFCSDFAWDLLLLQARRRGMLN